jgi:hypothetical protein
VIEDTDELVLSMVEMRRSPAKRDLVERAPVEVEVVYSLFG